MIEVSHLNFAYPGVEDAPGVAVFTDLNLEIEDGSFVAILGGNGCGKSTLAKHFNSILLPCGGKVYVSGMDTADEDKLIAIRRHVGMVFQNPDNQIVANVVEEDVAFGPENLGLPREEIRRRVVNALNVVGMQEYAPHAPHKLSGGQKQRIGIARALYKQASVLLLDEATSALDNMTERDINLTLLQLKESNEGLTILSIAHRESSLIYCDRIITIGNE